MIASHRALVLMLICAHSAVPEPKPGVLSLCDLFRNLDAYDGQRVTVRAPYRFGREIAGLYSGPCEPTVQLDGRIIEPHVNIVFGSMANASETAQANKKRFDESVKEAASGSQIAIILTVMGHLRTSSPSTPKIDEDGTLRKVRSFGHLGVHPAELRVESIQSVETVPDAGLPANFRVAPRRH
jgi:hypothetical protein